MHVLQQFGSVHGVVVNQYSFKNSLLPSYQTCALLCYIGAQVCHQPVRLQRQLAGPVIYTYFNLLHLCTEPPSSGAASTAACRPRNKHMSYSVASVHRATINRYGFNSLGADAVQDNLTLFAANVKKNPALKPGALFKGCLHCAICWQCLKVVCIVRSAGND